MGNRTVTQTHSDKAIAALLFAWATYHLTRHLRAMRPSHTSEQIAARVAVTGNPTGA